MPTTTHTTEPRAVRAVTDRPVDATDGVRVGPGTRDRATSAPTTPPGWRRADAVSEHPTAVLGVRHAATHPRGLGRLAKVFHSGARIPYHVYPQQQFASLVAGGEPELDGLLVIHDAAVRPLTVHNTGTDDLVLFKFFGPDVNPRTRRGPADGAVA